MPVRVFVRYLCTDFCLNWRRTAARTAQRDARSMVVNFMFGWWLGFGEFGVLVSESVGAGALAGACRLYGSCGIGTGTELWLTEAGTSPHFADAAFWSKTKAYTAEKCVRGCGDESYISRLWPSRPTRTVTRIKHCQHIHHSLTPPNSKERSPS
jgi:hypothetical protein